MENKVTYYICKKTMKMNHDNSMAFEKGMVYKCVRKGHEMLNYIFVSDFSNRHEMSKESVKKHLVKIKDKSVVNMIRAFKNE